LYEKISCQDQIKFITDDYLQIYKTLQLFTSLFTEITNIFTNTKAIKMPSLLRLVLIKADCEILA